MPAPGPTGALFCWEGVGRSVRCGVSVEIRSLGCSRANADQEIETRSFGPVYEDSFRIALDASHDCVVEGTSPKTTLKDSTQDLLLFAHVGRAFLAT